MSGGEDSRILDRILAAREGGVNDHGDDAKSCVRLCHEMREKDEGIRQVFSCCFVCSRDNKASRILVLMLEEKHHLLTANFCLGCRQGGVCVCGR